MKDILTNILIYFDLIVTIGFVIAKLNGGITWNWWWIYVGLWGPAILTIIAAMIANVIDEVRYCA